jgi:F0F1-type ATP synthase beta subunit
LPLHEVQQLLGDHCVLCGCNECQDTLIAWDGCCDTQEALNVPVGKQQDAFNVLVKKLMIEDVNAENVFLFTVRHQPC